MLVFSLVGWLAAGLAARYAVRWRRLFRLSESRLREAYLRKLMARADARDTVRKASLRVAELERVVATMRARGHYADRWLA